MEQQSKKELRVALVFLLLATCLAVVVFVAKDYAEQRKLDAQEAKAEEEEQEQQTLERNRENQLAEVKSSYADWIENAARGGETVISLASILGAREAEGFYPERTRPDIHDFVIGTVSWKSRTISAAKGKAMLPLINRSEGEKAWLCILFAAINDQEFGMWRDAEFEPCENSEAQNTIREWTTRNSFTSK